MRKDAFSNLGLAYRLARKGFLVSTATLTEIMYYMSYLQKHGIKKANYTLAGWLEAVASAATQRAVEKKIKRIFAASGLVDTSLIDVESTTRHSKFIVPRDFDGEQVLVPGMTYRDAFTKYCGVVNVGPFGCIQTRLADAVTVPTANMKGKRESFACAGVPVLACRLLRRRAHPVPHRRIGRQSLPAAAGGEVRELLPAGDPRREEDGQERGRRAERIAAARGGLERPLIQPAGARRRQSRALSG